MYFKVTLKRVRNHCCSGKAISITYFECVFVALLIQHAMRMRHIVICGLSGSTKFFQVISQTPDSRIKVIKHKMRVLFLSTTFVRNISSSKNNWARYDHKFVLVVICQISIKLDFFDRFSKIAKILNFMKIHQWKPRCCMRTDRRTSRHDEATSHFSQSCDICLTTNHYLKLHIHTPIIRCKRQKKPSRRETLDKKSQTDRHVDE
jgi:hypothetical protein